MQEALAAALEGRTALVIAHRLSTDPRRRRHPRASRPAGSSSGAPTPSSSPPAAATPSCTARSSPRRPRRPSIRVRTLATRVFAARRGRDPPGDPHHPDGAGRGDESRTRTASRSSTLIVQTTTIEVMAATLAAPGHAEAGPVVATIGPMPGRASTHCSKRGLERTKQAAAMMKNTVVGRPGTTSPMEPMATASHPSPNQSHRSTVPVSPVRRDSRRVAVVRRCG